MELKKMADNTTLKYITWAAAFFLFFLVIVGVGLEVKEFGLDNIGSKVAQYVFLGTDDLNSLNIKTETGTLINTIALLITALMIWVIIFFAFGDIIENFSAFSSGIGWVIAFAVAVIAANVKLISKFLVWGVAAFAFAGAAAVFLALIGSFVAFFLVNWGAGWALQWIKNRQIMIEAATGRAYSSEGLKTLIKTGKVVSKESNK